MVPGTGAGPRGAGPRGAGRAVGTRSVLAADDRPGHPGSRPAAGGAPAGGGWRALRCSTAQSVPTGPWVPPQAGAAALPRLQPSCQSSASWPPAGGSSRRGHGGQGSSPALERGRRLGGSFAPWPWPMPSPGISPPFRCCWICSSGASVGGCCWCHGRAPHPWCCSRSEAGRAVAAPQAGPLEPVAWHRVHPSPRSGGWWPPPPLPGGAERGPAAGRNAAAAAAGLGAGAWPPHPLVRGARGPLGAGLLPCLGLSGSDLSHQLAGSPTGLRPGLSSLRGGLKDRARPAARVLDPAPAPWKRPALRHSWRTRSPIRTSTAAAGWRVPIPASSSPSMRPAPIAPSPGSVSLWMRCSSSSGPSCRRRRWIRSWRSSCPFEGVWGGRPPAPPFFRQDPSRRAVHPQHQ
jgi:hypothetical protein